MLCDQDPYTKGVVRLDSHILSSRTPSISLNMLTNEPVCLHLMTLYMCICVHITSISRCIDTSACTCKVHLLTRNLSGNTYMHVKYSKTKVTPHNHCTLCALYVYIPESEDMAALFPNYSTIIRRVITIMATNL